MSWAFAARRLAARLEQPDLEHLARVVPLVDRGVDVEALVALEPDQPRAEARREDLGELGLADARLALEEERAARAGGRGTSPSRATGRRRSRGRGTRPGSPRSSRGRPGWRSALQPWSAESTRATGARAGRPTRRRWQAPRRSCSPTAARAARRRPRRRATRRRPTTDHQASASRCARARRRSSGRAGGGPPGAAPHCDV